MPRLTITASDLKRSTIVEEAGWYPLVVTAVSEEKSKKGDSMNTIVDMEVLPSSDPRKGKYAGVPVRRYFSEKAPGMAKSYIEACTGQPIPPEGGDFELDGTVGRQIEGYIKTRLDDGKQMNDVVDFRAMKTTA